MTTEEPEEEAKNIAAPNMVIPNNLITNPPSSAHQAYDSKLSSSSQAVRSSKATYQRSDSRQT